MQTTNIRHKQITVLSRENRLAIVFHRPIRPTQKLYCCEHTLHDRTMVVCNIIKLHCSIVKIKKKKKIADLQMASSTCTSTDTNEIALFTWKIIEKEIFVLFMM